MTRYECMQLKLSDMPEDLIEHYHLLDNATPDRYIYCEIHQGMYWVPQAGIITQEHLAKRLKKHGYTQSKTMPGLWMHEWHPIFFSLVVDDFGVKYIRDEHAQHLLQTVQKYYKCSFEKEGERYCKLTIKWDYAGQKMHLFMPLYVKNALKHFQHPPPIVPQDQPHPHVKKMYGAKVYHDNLLNNSPPLIKQERYLFRRSLGYFFFSCKLLIQQCSPRSAHLRPIKQHLEKTLCKNAFNF
jgi:hypothetical protein